MNPHNIRISVLNKQIFAVALKQNFARIDVLSEADIVLSTGCDVRLAVVNRVPPVSDVESIRITAGTADKIIASRAAEQIIVADSADKTVIARFAVNYIIPGSCINAIVSRSGIEHLVGVVKIRCGISFQKIVLRRAVNHSHFCFNILGIPHFSVGEQNAFDTTFSVRKTISASDSDKIIFVISDNQIFTVAFQPNLIHVDVLSKNNPAARVGSKTNRFEFLFRQTR